VIWNGICPPSSASDVQNAVVVFTFISFLAALSTYVLPNPGPSERLWDRWKMVGSS
jgi:hypothetical protein